MSQKQISGTANLRVPKVIRKIGEYKSLGMGWTDMAEQLYKDYKIVTTHDRVRNVYLELINKNADIIVGDEKLKGLLKQTVIDQASQLSKINKITNRLLDDISEKDDPDVDSLVKITKEIRHQIVLQAKLLGSLKDGIDSKQINKVEYTKISVNNLGDLEKEGYIKILRKPGEPFNPNKNEVIKLEKNKIEDLLRDGVCYVDNYTIKIDRRSSLDIPEETKEGEQVEESEQQD